MASVASKPPSAQKSAIFANWRKSPDKGVLPTPKSPFSHPKMRKSPYCTAIWALLHCNIGHFASPKSLFWSAVFAVLGAQSGRSGVLKSHFSLREELVLGFRSAIFAPKLSYFATSFCQNLVKKTVSCPTENSELHDFPRCDMAQMKDFR